MLGTALPLAYLAKSFLKWCFGRLETRLWLVEPDQYGMHWFNGVNGYDAFPSGHMLVITQLFLAIWFFYPRLRLVNLLAWIGLAFALIATNYHFVADVIAGVYIAIVLYWLCARVLIKESQINTN
ncbi:MAG: phosphatase PAP2 family protein [Pseudomonadota bacterium]